MDAFRKWSEPFVINGNGIRQDVGNSDNANAKVGDRRNRSKGGGGLNGAKGEFKSDRHVRVHSKYTC